MSMAPSDNRSRRSARLDLSRPLDVAPALLPFSPHRFDPLPAPDVSDLALIRTLYGVRATEYYLKHGVWPRFAAPGCACAGEAVWG
jgi:hypothetical protein